MVALAMCILNPFVGIACDMMVMMLTSLIKNVSLVETEAVVVYRYNGRISALAVKVVGEARSSYAIQQQCNHQHSAQLTSASQDELFHSTGSTALT
jgi:hypothetical protein